MDRPGTVKLESGFLHTEVVLAAGGFIAQRPDGDAGVIAVPEDHPLHAVDDRLCPARIIARHVLFPDTMGLDVAFIHDVEAHLITEIVEDISLRIVRSADGVEVGLLHERQVFPVEFFGYGITLIRGEGVIVHTA